MIKRLYVNNFRSLVGFTMNFDTMDIFCGANGAGKSSVFDAVRFVCSLASGNCILGKGLSGGAGNVVSRLDFTSWMQSTVQDFEIDIFSDNHDFHYEIHLEQEGLHEPRVLKESATCDGKELYIRDVDGVHFDGGRSGFPLDWHRAALASIQPVPERKEIALLQEALSGLLILRPDVRSMEVESKEENDGLEISLSNFTSWYRHFSADQEFTDLLRDSLQYVWEDIKFLKLEKAGMDVKVLKLCFDGVDIFFNQLSDGEKMIVGLYAIYVALRLNKVHTVMIDEPDNYIGLQELQPWLLSMSELVDEEHQVILISHNGEILNVGAGKRYFFKRDNHSSPARVGRLNVPEGLVASEVIARGWADVGGNGDLQ